MVRQSRYALKGATDYNQQRLPAWKPDLDPKTVFLALLAIGTLFIPVGIGLLMASNNVYEKVLDYTHCHRTPRPNDLNGSPAFRTCASFVAHQKHPDARCTCRVDFDLPDGISGNVVIFYALSNFYQNHRHFLKSRDELQLLGRAGVSQSCYPFDYLNGSMIVPCGAFANSIYNDSIELWTGDFAVPLHRTGLAWPLEKALFHNPDGEMLNESYREYVKPPSWSKNIWDLDPEIPFNNGMENEDFIIWMRPAAFPSFRKTFRIVDHSVERLYGGLPAGNYTFLVEYNFPVLAYGGRKFLTLSNASAFGGKNPFLGICYIATGVFVILTALVLFIIHKKWGVRDALDIRKTDPFYW